MAYEVRIRRSTLNYLNKLDVPTRRRLTAAIEGLAEVPPAGDIRPLTGQTGAYRLRVGGFSSSTSTTSRKLSSWTPSAHEATSTNSVPRGRRAPMVLGRLGGSYRLACSEHRADTGHGCCAERLSPR